MCLRTEPARGADTKVVAFREELSQAQLKAVLGEVQRRDNAAFFGSSRGVVAAWEEHEDPSRTVCRPARSTALAAATASASMWRRLSMRQVPSAIQPYILTAHTACCTWRRTGPRLSHRKSCRRLKPITFCGAEVTTRSRQGFPGLPGHKWGNWKLTLQNGAAAGFMLASLLSQMALIPEPRKPN